MFRIISFKEWFVDIFIAFETKLFSQINSKCIKYSIDGLRASSISHNVSKCIDMLVT